MNTTQTATSTAAPEAVPAAAGRQPYALQLYVAGGTERSMRAIANTRKYCEEFLFERYQLEIIDIYQSSALVRSARIIAAPTLVRLEPLPVKRIVGEMDDIERITVLDVLRIELEVEP